MITHPPAQLLHTPGSATFALFVTGLQQATLPIMASVIATGLDLALPTVKGEGDDAKDLVLYGAQVRDLVEGWRRASTRRRQGSLSFETRRCGR